MEKNCFHCQHYIPKSGGSYWEPPEPAECEAANEEMPDSLIEKFDELSWDEGTVAKICPFFEPIMVGECCECHKPINQPAWEWKLWAEGWEPTPVCSEECRVALNTKWDAYLERTKEEL